MVCDGSMVYFEGDAPEGEQGWGEAEDVFYGILGYEFGEMDDEEGDDGDE